VALALDDETATRLARTRAHLGQEFDELPQAEVDRRFDGIVTQLLAEARFDDFVPVLAWRYAREELQTETAHPG